SESIEPTAATTEAAGGKREAASVPSEPARIAPVVSATASATPRVPAQPGEEEEQQQQDDEQRQGRYLNALALIAGRRFALVTLPDALGDGGDATLEALLEAPGAERRDHLAILDRAHQAIGKDALDAVAGENAQLAILGDEDDEDARVLSLPSHLPRVRDAHGVSEVVERLGGGNREDGDLRAGLVLERLDGLRHPLACVRWDDAGQVGDEALRLRDGRLGGVCCERHQHGQQDAPREVRATH